jgi:hypothetical protein
MNFIKHHIKKFRREKTGCVKLFFIGISGLHDILQEINVYVDLFCMGVGQLCRLVIHIHILANIYGTHVYKSAKL